jgi:hypothetical protein
VTVSGVAKKHGIVASKLSTVRTGVKKKAGKPKPQSFAEIAVLPEAAFDGTEGSIRVSMYGDQPMRFELVIY